MALENFANAFEAQFRNQAQQCNIPIDTFPVVSEVCATPEHNVRTL